MKLTTCLAGLILTFLATTSNAQQLSLGTPTFGGNGCSNGTARATLSPDGQQISILFDSFIANAGGNTGLDIDRKNCDIAIPVQVPQGYSVAVFTIDYRGFAAIPDGGRLRFSADYFFAGKNSRRYSKEFTGPLNDNYTFRNELRSDLDVWSACGASVILRTQSSMVAETNMRRDDVMATVDSVDVQSGITYNFQYRKCGDTPPPPPPPRPPNPPAPPVGDQNIHGYIDGFQDLGAAGVVLNGWACAKTVNSSIDVHVYVNQAAGNRGAQFVKAARANAPSEPAVAQQCRTNFSAHRFSIPFSREEALQYTNTTVWVHGISPVGLSNSTIGNSGKVRFPNVQQTIQGAITQVTGSGAGNMVNGYTCMTARKKALEIEAFVGGPAGVGTFMGTTKADSYVDDGWIRGKCGNVSDVFGFALNLPAHLVANKVGQPIFVYTVDPTTGTLIPLEGSGGYTVVPSFEGF